MTSDYFSATWNTEFLELPPRMKLLTTFENIPTRPTAKIELKFDPKTDSVVVNVIESGKIQMENHVARLRGEKLELAYPKFDPSSNATETVWTTWDENSKNFTSEVEAICWKVLLGSDVGCPAQARHDMPEASKSSLWNKLWDEMQKLYPVAHVMLS